jgi:TRAP-type C4-dicarboxylate transport system permease small subunit
MKLWKVIDRIVDSLAALLLLATSSVLALQVIYRYLLNRPLGWPLEVSLLCFVWMVWLGGAAGMREERQVRIEFAEKYLPHSVQRILIPLSTLLSLAFMAFVVFYGVRVAESQMSAEYDILPFPRGILYAVAPVVGVLMFLYLIRVLIRQIRRYFSAGETREERNR